MATDITHGIAGGYYNEWIDGDFVCDDNDPRLTHPMLHDWGSEDEMLDKLTDPDLPRQYCRNLGRRGGRGPEWGYYLVQITQADVDYELARRRQDQADQRAHSWAM